MEINIKLRKEIQLRDEKINNLEKDLEIKDLQIRELLDIHKYNIQKIECLKKIIKNKNRKTIIDEEDKKIILSKSPETIIDTLDINNIFQLNNKISNEHDFALIFANNKITNHILVSDSSRFKASYISKNSELIKDEQCIKLSNLIYSLSKDSAEKFIRDYNQLEDEIVQNRIINGKGNTTKAKKLLSDKKEFANRIINKNDKSLEKFGKQIIRYSKLPIKYILNNNNI